MKINMDLMIATANFSSSSFKDEKGGICMVMAFVLIRVGTGTHMDCSDGMT
jgi:hypothetical protein